MASYPCIVCQRRQENHPDLIFHRFPDNKRSCRRWQRVLNINSIRGKTPEQLNCSHRVCSHHFSEKNYQTEFPSRFRQDACPDQNLEVDNVNSGEICRSQKDLKNISVDLDISDRRKSGKENSRQHEKDDIHQPATASDDIQEHFGDQSVNYSRNKSHHSGIARRKFAGRSKKDSEHGELLNPSIRLPVKKRRGQKPTYSLAQIRLWAKKAMEMKRQPEDSEVVCNHDESFKDSLNECGIKSTSGGPSNPSSRGDPKHAYIGPFRYTVPLGKEVQGPITKEKNVKSAETDEIQYLGMRTLHQPGSVSSNTSLSNQTTKGRANLRCIEKKSPLKSKRVATHSRKPIKVPTVTRMAKCMVEENVMPKIKRLHPVTKSEDVQQTTKILYSTEQIILDDIGAEGDTSQTCECATHCDCKTYKSRPEASKTSKNQRPYKGHMRRQMVTSKRDKKQTFMFVSKSTLRTLQKKGPLQQVEKDTGSDKPSNCMEYKTSLRTTSPTPLLVPDQKGEKTESDGTETSLLQASISSEKHVQNTDSLACSETTDADLLTPSPLPSDSSCCKCQNSSACTAPPENPVPVVVTWSAATTTNTQSFTFTIKLPEERGGGPVLESGTHGSVTKSHQYSQYLKNQTLQSVISDTTMDLEFPMSPGVPNHNTPTRPNTSSNEPGRNMNFSPLPDTTLYPSTAKMSGCDINRTPTLAYIPEDNGIACHSPPAVVPSSPQDSQINMHQSQTETMDIPNDIFNGPYQVKRGLEICRYNNKEALDAQSSAEKVSYDTLPTNPIRKFTRDSPVPHPTDQYTAAYYEKEKQKMKDKYKRLLKEHREKYFQLLEKYKILEKRSRMAGYIGSREQVVRDARNYLSEEHVLFLESQMFLRNRIGTGNRFSKKFIRYMMMLYERSAAGYRFLRSLFTIPTVKTIQKWQSRPYDILDESLNDPLEIIVDNHEVDLLNGSIPEDEMIHRQENMVISISRDAIEKEFFPSQRHFSVGNVSEDDEEEESFSDDKEDESFDPDDPDDVQMIDNGGEENFTMASGKGVNDGDGLAIEDLISLE